MAESDLRMGVLELLRLQRAGEQELVAALSPVERAARGTPEQWSAKDLIAHITAWRLLTADRLRAALEGFEPRPVRPDDEENADFFAEYSERSWYDVEAAADRSVAELADLLPAFPDADLTDAQRYPWNGGRPLLHSVMGNGVEHPAGHLDEWHRLRGEPEHGLQHHEALVTASRNNRLPDQLLGNAIYNLACAHALAGDADRAIAFLSEALQLHPGLTHLARDDADFVAIRSLPAFQSLVAAPSDAPSDARRTERGLTPGPLDATSAPSARCLTAAPLPVRSTGGAGGRARLEPSAMHTLDVLLPTYNRRDSLILTLAGLATQTHSDFRLIVADQSDEPTGDLPVIQALRGTIAVRGGTVEWHTRRQVHGIAEQRDFLLRQATADAILYLDDDVLMESWVVERLLAVLARERCGFVGAFPMQTRYRDDVRPDQQRLELWNGPVQPEVVTPGSAAWGRADLHRAANLYHAGLRYPDGATRLYKVSWVASCVLYDRRKVEAVGGFAFWPRLPRYHSGEEVVVQNLLLRRWGGCAIMPSGTYFSQLPSTVLNPAGTVDGHALDLLPELIARYASESVGSSADPAGVP